MLKLYSKGSAMQVIINGEKQILKDDISLIDILKILNIQEKVVAIALNTDIIKKDKWENTIVHNNDTLELLQFVSGG